MKFSIISICLFLLFCADVFSFAAEDEFEPADVMDSYLSQHKDLNEKLADEILASSPAKSVNFQENLHKEEGFLFSANLAGPAKISSNPEGRRLWEAVIASADENDIQGRGDLEKMMAYLNSFKVKTAAAVVEKTEPAANNSAALPQTPAAAPIADEPIEDTSAAEKIQQPAVSEDKITEDTLIQIKENIDKIENPYQLAEVLFQSGRLDYAALCYKQALKAAYLQNFPQDRAWVIFQLANCLKDTSEQESLEYYSRLLSEYPDCSWAKIAKSQSEILSLQLREKPYELIKQQRLDVEAGKLNE